MKLSWPVALATAVVLSTVVFVLYSINISQQYIDDAPHAKPPIDSYNNDLNETANSRGRNTPSDSRMEELGPQPNPLPIDILLLGTDLSGKIALLESESEVVSYVVGDLVFKQPIQLIHVEESVATFLFENMEFQITLFDANLLANKHKATNSELSQMTAIEIGNRPKLLEHIIDLSKTAERPFYASPGISEKLFKQAGLLQGDIINKINDVTLNDDVALKNLSQDIQALDTVKFEVLRQGRTITLYLDIPSEDLSFK